jgi:hypothetical protein
MGFWRGNMPERMLLRSGTDWHLDADGINTFEAFLLERGVDPTRVSPVPLRTFLDYTDWFCEQKQIQPRPSFVSRLDVADGQFIASLDDGQRLYSSIAYVAEFGRETISLPAADSRTTMPATPCSRTMMFDPPPSSRTGRSDSRQRRTSAASSSAVLGSAKYSAAPPK